MKIRIVNACIGDNIGDKVIVFNTVDAIKSIDANAIVSYDEYISDYKLTPENFWDKVDEALRPESQGVHDKVNQIREADFVIAIGGGYLCDFDRNGFNNLILYKLFEPAIAIKLNKPVFFCSHTIDIYNRFVEPILVQILRKSQVTTRDSVSSGYLERLGIKYIETADMAFLTNLTKLLPKSDVVGVCLRGDRPINKKLWNKVLKNFECEFFTSRNVDLEQMKEINKDIFCVEPFENFKEVCKHISKYKLVISDRFHIIIGALLVDVPFIPLPTLSHKIDGLTDMLLDYTVEELKEKAKVNVDIIRKLMK